MIPADRVPRQLVAYKIDPHVEPEFDDGTLLEFGDHAMYANPHCVDEIHNASFVGRLVDSYNVGASYINPLGIDSVLTHAKALHDLYHDQTDHTTDTWQAVWHEALHNLWWSIDNLKKRS